MKEKEKVIIAYFEHKERISNLSLLIENEEKEIINLQNKMKENIAVDLPNNSNEVIGGGSANICYFENAIVNRLSNIQNNIKNKQILIFEKQTEKDLLETELSTLEIRTKSLAEEEKELLFYIFIKKFSIVKISDMLNISSSSIYRIKKEALKKIL